MISRIRKRYRLKKKFPLCKISSDIKIVGPYKNLKIGANTEIQHDVYFHLGGFEWCDFTGSLIIGENSIVSHNVIIYAGGPGGVITGEKFRCGPGVKIFSSFEDYRNKYNVSFGTVKIGDNVMLCTDVIVNFGITIGSNSVIGANSVVLNDIPENVFAAGNPAKVIKSLK